jgi:AcrR family transcriptional regulator
LRAFRPARRSGGHRGRAGRRLRRAERRKQILDATTRASARSGFVTTSLDDAAAEAGITHVILYRHPRFQGRHVPGRA